MIALMYHDIVAAEDADASGFPGRDAALYKVTPERFSAHLAALSKCLFAVPPSTHPPSPSTAPARPASAVITFDDGGAAAMLAAELLEQHRFVGHFFMTTNYVGTPGFLDASHLRDLRARGHIIGSHSASHPLRMGHCSWPQLVDEWMRSREALTQLLGESIDSASVPGGDFAPAVAQAAAAAGFTRLFTSEPTRRIQSLFGVTVCGRFTVQRWTRPQTIAAVASGSWLPTARQSLIWNAKKISKQIGGERYLRLRRLLLRHGREVRWGDRA